MRIFSHGDYGQDIVSIKERQKLQKDADEISHKCLISNNKIHDDVEYPEKAEKITLNLDFYTLPVH